MTQTSIFSDHLLLNVYIDIVIDCVIVTTMGLGVNWEYTEYFAHLIFKIH